MFFGDRHHQRRALHFFWHTLLVSNDTRESVFCATIIIVITMTTTTITHETAAADDEDDDDYCEAGPLVAALPELWSRFAEYGDGIVCAFRLMSVCKAARVGMKTWLRTLPALVVCGGFVDGGAYTRKVWRFNLAELRWEHTSDLTRPRASHACCAVSGGIAVLGGDIGDDMPDESVEILQIVDSDILSSQRLPDMSCGCLLGSAALEALVESDESESGKGQVLLIGGDGLHVASFGPSEAVHKVDLATGVCTPQPPLVTGRFGFAAARLPDGRAVCAGGKPCSEFGYVGRITRSAEILDPPADVSSSNDTAWQWRQLPDMGVGRFGGSAGVLSDGRFAVFGGCDADEERTASCEVLTFFDGGERWDSLPPMHQPRCGHACAVVGRCVIVAGGEGEDSQPMEVFEEALGRWRRLPCALPESELCYTGSALV